MKAKHNPLAAVVMVGRDIFRIAVCAVAENPPSLLVIAISAVVGYVLQAMQARPGLVTALRLE